MHMEFERWVLDNTVYPDLTYHNFLREQAKPHDRILEVGVHIGSSFIGMLRDRSYEYAVGVDNFQQNSPKETCDNLKLFDIKNWYLEDSVDYLCVNNMIMQYQSTFIHLDADHSLQGTLNELWSVTRHESVQTIVVHDLIDPNVEQACATFMNWNNAYWKVRYIDAKTVFNGCIVLERK